MNYFCIITLQWGSVTGTLSATWTGDVPAEAASSRWDLFGLVIRHARHGFQIDGDASVLFFSAEPNDLEG